MDDKIPMNRSLTATMARIPGLVWVFTGLFDPSVVPPPNQIFFTDRQSDWEKQTIQYPAEKVVSYNRGAEAEQLMSDKAAKGLV